MTGRGRWWRALTIAVLGVVFALPFVAMLEFTTRGAHGRDWSTWSALVHVGTLSADYPDLVDGVVTSLELTVLTVALMLVLLVPTMVWVRLRLPRLQRALEFICLLPLTVPAIVLVVGLAPVYAWVVYLLGSSALTLTFAYTILVLPYAYRALDAGLSGLDVRTLSEAARTLGAGWGTVILRVVLPNLRSAVVSASFLSVALVLGEFTVASLLNQNNLQVAINLLSKRSAQLSVAMSLAVLLFGFVLLLSLTLAGALGRRRRSAQAPLTGVPTFEESA